MCGPGLAAELEMVDLKEVLLAVGGLCGRAGGEYRVSSG